MEFKDVKKKIAHFHFNKNETENGSINDSKEKIIIKFKIKNGKKDYKYQVKFHDLSNNTPQESEILICKEPNKPLDLLEVNYIYEFGKIQKLSIGLIIKNQTEEKHHNKEIIIGELLGNNKKNKNNTRIFPLGGKKDEKLEISSEILKKQKKFLRIHFSIDIMSECKITDEKMLEYFQNPQNKIFFMIEKLGEKIYESEVFTDDGKFNIVQIPTNILDSNFNIIFYSFKKEKSSQSIMIKENTVIKTNLDELVGPIRYGKPIYSKNLCLEDKLIIFNYSSIGEEITFLDYIKKGGIRIGLNIGIDFTKSNKPPNDPSSLHSYVNEQKNPYEKAILTCGKILEYYDYDLLFPVYGFGAVFEGETSYCFNINYFGDKKPEIEFVDKIINVYHKCIQKILFSGPTYFAPIINKIISNIKEQNDPREYQVLMILTDGIILDMANTIDALVEGSYYPLSVIIIGIGNADFAKMNELDGDKIPLISRKGIKRQRDLVQFVPFNKYEGDINKLVYEVLEEIPRQVIEYYTLNYVYPDMIKEEGKIKINIIDNFPKNNLKESKLDNPFESVNFNNTIEIGEKEYYKRKDKPFEEDKIYEEVKNMFPKKTKKNAQQFDIKTIQRRISDKKYETFQRQDSSNNGLNSQINNSTLMTENYPLTNRINYKNNF